MQNKYSAESCRTMIWSAYSISPSTFIYTFTSYDPANSRRWSPCHTQDPCSLQWPAYLPSWGTHDMDMAIRYNTADLFEQILPNAELGVMVTVCVAPEALPWEPAHRGSQAQTIVQTWNKAFVIQTIPDSGLTFRKRMLPFIISIAFTCHNGALK